MRTGLQATVVVDGNLLTMDYSAMTGAQLSDVLHEKRREDLITTLLYLMGLMHGIESRLRDLQTEMGIKHDD